MPRETGTEGYQQPTRTPVGSEGGRLDRKTADVLPDKMSQLPSLPPTTLEEFTNLAVLQDKAYKVAGFLGALAVGADELYQPDLVKSSDKPDVNAEDNAFQGKRALEESAKTLANYAGSLGGSLADSKEHYKDAFTAEKNRVTKLTELKKVVGNDVRLAADLHLDQVKDTHDGIFTVLKNVRERNPQLAEALDNSPIPATYDHPYILVQEEGKKDRVLIAGTEVTVPFSPSERKIIVAIPVGKENRISGPELIAKALPDHVQTPTNPRTIGASVANIRAKIAKVNGPGIHSLSSPINGGYWFETDTVRHEEVTEQASGEVVVFEKDGSTYTHPYEEVSPKKHGIIATHAVRVVGTDAVVGLGPKERNLLFALPVGEENRVLGKTLLDQVWPDGTVTNLGTHMTNLRKKLDKVDGPQVRAQSGNKNAGYWLEPRTVEREAD